MQKRTGLLSLILLSVFAMLLIAGCGNSESDNNPNLGKWVATEAKMKGLTISTKSVLGKDEMSFDLKKGGKCVASVEGKQKTIDFTIKDNVLNLKGSGLDINGKFINGRLVFDDMMGNKGLTIVFDRDGQPPAAQKKQ